MFRKFKANKKGEMLTQLAFELGYSLAENPFDGELTWVRNKDGYNVLSAIEDRIEKLQERIEKIEGVKEDRSEQVYRNDD